MVALLQSRLCDGPATEQASPRLRKGAYVVFIELHLDPRTPGSCHIRENATPFATPRYQPWRIENISPLTMEATSMHELVAASLLCLYAAACEIISPLGDDLHLLTTCQPIMEFFFAAVRWARDCTRRTAALDSHEPCNPLRNWRRHEHASCI